MEKRMLSVAHSIAVMEHQGERRMKRRCMSQKKRRLANAQRGRMTWEKMEMNAGILEPTREIHGRVSRAFERDKR